MNNFNNAMVEALNEISENRNALGLTSVFMTAEGFFLHGNEDAFPYSEEGVAMAWKTTNEHIKMLEEATKLVASMNEQRLTYQVECSPISLRRDVILAMGEEFDIFEEDAMKALSSLWEEEVSDKLLPVFFEAMQPLRILANMPEYEEEYGMVLVNGQYQAVTGELLQQEMKQCMLLACERRSIPATQITPLKELLDRFLSSSSLAERLEICRQVSQQRQKLMKLMFILCQVVAENASDADLVTVNKARAKELAMMTEAVQVTASGLYVNSTFYSYVNASEVLDMLEQQMNNMHLLLRLKTITSVVLKANPF